MRQSCTGLRKLLPDDGAVGLHIGFIDGNFSIRQDTARALPYAVAGRGGSRDGKRFVRPIARFGSLGPQLLQNGRYAADQFSSGCPWIIANGFDDQTCVPRRVKVRETHSPETSI